MRILSLLLAFVLAVSPAAAKIITLGALPAGGAVSYGTISVQQELSATSTQVATGTANVTFALGSVPTVGHIVVCVAGIRNSPARTLTIADDMTDGGNWSSIAPYSRFATSSADNQYYFAKVVGATANSNKTMTVTPSNTSYGSLVLNCGEWKTTAGSFATDGSNGSDGSIGLTSIQPGASGGSSTSSLCFAYTALTSPGTITSVDSGFTIRASTSTDRRRGWADAIVNGSVNPTWTIVAGPYGTSIACYKAL